MNIREIVDHINKIEDTIPVQEWTYNGMDVWPIIRTRLYFDLFNHSAFQTWDETIKPKKSVRILNFVKDKIRTELQALKQFLLTPGFKRTKLRRSDAVFLADPSYINMGGTYYQRFCDPIIDDLKSMNQSAAVLTTLQDRSTKTATPSYFISTDYWIRYSLQHIKTFLGLNRRGALSLPGLYQYNEYVSKLGEGAKPVTMRSFLHEMSMYESMTAYFTKILRKTRPKCAFIVSYYDDYGMAFVYACRSMDIPVADLQHGAINDFNGGYGRWNNIPKDGYNTLPNYFTCWDQAAVDSIEAWSRNTTAHKPVLFGNRFLEMFVNGTSPYSDDFAKIFRRIQDQFKPVKNILLSLQTKYVMTDFLQQTMKHASEPCFWWIRLHPMMAPAEIGSVHESLRKIQGVNFDIEESTNHLLYSILPHMDCHITLNSSVVQEAVSFGVPSIICEETGYEYYAREIAEGHAYAAMTPQEAAQLINRLHRVSAGASHASPEALYRELGLKTPQQSDKKKSALIISLTPVTDEPRVRRQALSLIDAGWDVIVAGYEGRASVPQGWTLITLPYHRPVFTNRYIQFAFKQLRRSIYLPLIAAGRFSDNLANFAYWADRLTQRNFRALKESLPDRPDIKPSLIIGHDYLTAPMADELAADYRCAFSIDIHEYSREQYDHRMVWRLIFKPWVHRIQSIYLKKSAFNSTVCDGIARLLETDYGIVRPAVIRSVPSYIEMPFKPAANDNITVMYHGIIYPARGLELAIQSLPQWRDEFKLIIRGPGNQPYMNKLQSLADTLGVSHRVSFEPPVLFHEIIPAANKADIGYFVQEDFSAQKHFALPNKFFEYIAAGLALCIGDQPEMAKIMRQYDLGKLPDSMTPDSIAKTINSFTREDINRYKQNSLTAAKELSWQEESAKLVAAYEGLL